MKTFKDSKGRDWDVRVDLNAIDRVKAGLNVNLLELVQGELARKAAEDPVLLGDLLYHVCKPYAEDRKVSREDFFRDISDCIDNATAALLEETSVFFSSRVRKEARPLLEKARSKVQAVQSALLAKAERELEAINPEEEAEKILASYRKSESSPPAGGSPASVASTPAPSPSGS